MSNVDDHNWQMKAKLMHMNDFEFTYTRVQGRGVNPSNAGQQTCETELNYSKKCEAFRQSNGRPRKSECLLDCTIDATTRELFGGAERWVARFNASNAKNGFKVEVQRPRQG
jgi:hypothetical protein